MAAMVPGVEKSGIHRGVSSGRLLEAGDSSATAVDWAGSPGLESRKASNDMFEPRFQ